MNSCLLRERSFASWSWEGKSFQLLRRSSLRGFGRWPPAGLPWKPCQKDEPCISKIERLTLISAPQVGPNLKFWRFSILQILLSFLDLTLIFCIWSVYLYRFKMSIAIWYLRQLFYWFLDWGAEHPPKKTFLHFSNAKLERVKMLILK